MTYTVARAFQDIDGITRQPGWQVELSLDRAIRLHRWGFIVGPISMPVPPSAWQTIAGTARRATSREENVAGLASACDLANDLRTQLNAHYADVADHTAAPDTDHVIVGTGAISLAALLALTAEMLTSYDAHDADAELPANWVYHAAQEAGDHSLASAAAPVNLQECITRLNDLKGKFNAHDADNTCHGVGSKYQVASADAAYGAVVRIPAQGVELTDLTAWGILDSGSGTVVGVRAAAGNGHVDFEFDADPQNDCIISYLVTRRVPG